MKLLFAMALAILVVIGLAATGEVVGRGAVYTRWGKAACDPQNELVYTGYAGGQHYAHTGGASNYLCMPADPQYGNTDPGSTMDGMLYGAEYETWNYSPFDNKRGSRVVNNHDVPCAVCLSKRSTTILMVPARTECHSEWKLKYTGYLMSAHHGHPGRTEYICMDGAPEGATGGIANRNGVLFYPVKSSCGSLPCPPYVDKSELTCVVCSHA